MSRDHFVEADITINGRSLSIGQALAVRVAVTDFYQQMHNDTALGDDEHWRAMTAAYRTRLLEVLTLLIEQQKAEPEASSRKPDAIDDTAAALGWKREHVVDALRKMHADREQKAEPEGEE